MLAHAVEPGRVDKDGNSWRIGTSLFRVFVAHDEQKPVAMFPVRINGQTICILADRDHSAFPRQCRFDGGDLSGGNDLIRRAEHSKRQSGIDHGFVGHELAGPQPAFHLPPGGPICGPGAIVPVFS